MPQSLDVAAVSALALQGLVGLMVTAIAERVRGFTDRGIQNVMRLVGDRLAGMRDAPEGKTVARAIRLSELEALEQVIRQYEDSLGPKFFRPWKTSRFIKRAKKYCASALRRHIDVAESLDADLRSPALAAASVVLAGAPAEGSAEDLAARLRAAAETAVLDELTQAVGTSTLPRGFEEYFRRGKPGYSSFTTLFRRNLQRQLETNEKFKRVYSTQLLARIDQVSQATHDLVEEVKAGVGAVNQSMRTGITDSADLLPAGNTLHFATTDFFFGGRLSSGRTFNHARPLVGRDDLVARIIADIRQLQETAGGGIVTIGGIGGAGKSRVLIEVARRLQSDLSVRWVREDSDVTLRALSELPRGPLLLICDDAQRRTDLANVFAMAETRGDGTTILLGTRPYGRAALRAALDRASISLDRCHDLGDLPEIPADDLVHAVEEELGPDYGHLAKEVLRLVGDSVLVALVAARLMRTRKLDPRVIVLDQEFRTTVLERFRDEAVGDLPGNLDPTAARRVLETLAAVQPLTLDEEVGGAFATYVGVEGSDLRRIVGALLDGGALREDHSGIRIVPDVLGDYILHGAMVARGKPTALDAEILTALGAPVLVNLVRNVAELDWQRTVAGQPIAIFAGVWESFTSAFMAAPNSRRAEWLDRLHPVAAFQPRGILALAGRLLENPKGDDRPSGLFQLRTSDIEVIRKLPPLLVIAAQHRDCSVEALGLLWRIGRADERATNAYPEHALRQLADVVGYSRRRSVEMQERALDALEQWLDDPSWADGPHSPLLVVNEVLRTEITEHSYNDRDHTVTMRRIGVHAEKTRAVRLRAIAMMKRVMAEAAPKGRHLALDRLLDALDRPNESYGHETSIEEEESFRDQYNACLDAIEDIVRRGADPLLLVTVRTHLHRSAHASLLPWKAERMRRLAENVPDSTETRLVRALGIGFRDWDPDRESYDEYQKSRARVIRAAADELVVPPNSSDLIAQTLKNMCELYESAGAQCNPGELLQVLADRHTDVACAVARWSLESTAAGKGGHPEWLPPILATLRVHRLSEYQVLLRRAAESNEAVLRWAAAAAMQRVQGDQRRSEQEIELTRSLMGDPELFVRRAALETLAFMQLNQVSQLLPAVTFRGDEASAQMLARVWSMPHGNEVLEPDEVTTRHLLDELVEVRRLGVAQWEVSVMLTVLARAHPELVIEFLLSRVQREQSEPPSASNFVYGASYDAVPYGGFEGLQEAMRSAETYEAAMEQLICSVTMTVDGISVRSEAPYRVLRMLGPWDDVFEKIVRRWAANRNCERLRSCAALFEVLPRDFVLTRREFVVDVLVAAEACEPLTKSAIQNSLEAGAFANDFVVHAVGEPTPTTLKISREAGAVADELSQAGNARTASFYARLQHRARLELDRSDRAGEE